MSTSTGAQPVEPATGGLDGLAARLAASDVLVFRKVAGDRYAHLGGLGRGEGWAGIVEIDAAAERRLADVIVAGDVLRVHQPVAVRIAGPYYARTAVVVPVDQDVVVVWGAQEGSASLAESPLETLCHASRRASEIVTAVSPAKALADELEVLEAVQSLTGVLTEGLQETMQRVAQVAAESLSCELAVVVLGSGRACTVTRDWSLGTDEVALHSAVIAAFEGLTAPACVQDAAETPLPAPLSPADGVVSYYAVPLGASVGGTLLVAHMARQPRGFTQLCQRLGRQVGEAASVVLQMANLRASFAEQLEVSSTQARRDPLTGVGNRFAWEEALDIAQAQLATGHPVTVVSVDLDLLKEANDVHGHGAGDRLIVALSRALRRCLREGDVVCRLGGDEFGLLLPHCGDPVAERVETRLREELARTRSTDGLPVHASLGVATAHPGGRLSSAFHEADIAMYQDKGRRAEHESQTRSR